MNQHIELNKNVFLKKFEKISENFYQKLNEYMSDPNDENIHDIRVSIRRLESAYQILPKSIRKKDKVRGYLRQAKKLFKLNATIRDFDIICTNMELRYPDKTVDLVSSLKNSRREYVKKANKLALKVSYLDIPKITKSDIKKSKLVKRHRKTIDNIILDIHKNSIISLGDETKINELHMLRKNFKKLRYLLELSSDKRTIQKILQSLKSIQDVLGEIHDMDIIIDHLRNIDQNSRYSDIIAIEVLNRNKKYSAFVTAFKKNSNAINLEL
jgi:CHAD domain-containing protein